MATLKIFLTEYKIGNEKFSTHIYARDLKEANKIVKKRAIGEQIIGTSDFSECLNKERLISFTHYLCFLGFIALKSGKATPEEILGDRGVIHEAMHLLDNGFDEITFQQFDQKVKWLFNITFTFSPVTALFSIIDGC